MSEEKITVYGKVSRIFSANEKTGFIIAACEPTKSIEAKYVNAVYGNFSVLGVGFLTDEVEYAFKGEFKKSKYGYTFHFDSYEVVIPEDEEGIVQHLQTLKGVGPTTAQRIVDRFGLQTIDIMELEPFRLLEVKGITQKKLDAIMENFTRNKDFENIVRYLSRFHVTTHKCVLIYERFGKGAEKKIAENPYILCGEIDRISFRTSDYIARSMKFPLDGFYRLEALIIHLLKEASKSGGHLYLTEKMLFKAFQKFAPSVSGIRFTEVLEALNSQEKIVMVDKGDKIYLTSFYVKEQIVAKKTQNLVCSSKNIANLENHFEEVQKANKITYDTIQKEAMLGLNNGSSFYIVTGGPGTGKSTIIKGILDIVKRDNPSAKILMAAPTGRAAKRMEEATGHKSSTIHRLLEFNPMDKKFDRCDSNPLTGDILIVDESSMIDINLFADLIVAVDKGMRLIMVGDIDQLPPVGAGYVFRDLIQSGIVPVVKLNKVFRQADGSKIKYNASLIRDGQTKLSIDKDTFSLRSYAKKNDNSDLKLILGECVLRFMDSYKKLEAKKISSPIFQVQVLSPMRKGILGVENINDKIQEAYNPSSSEKKEFQFNRTEMVPLIYREGDKVMQIVNDYDKNVFNGDMGTIVSLRTTDDVMVVQFENDEEVVYEKTEVRESLVLAYCSTVHKSQGSEYHTVILITSYTHSLMRQRNLVYTGITRAKESVFILGDAQSLMMAINNNKQSIRNSRLTELLVKYHKGLEAV